MFTGFFFLNIAISIERNTILTRISRVLSTTPTSGTEFESFIGEFHILGDVF